MLRLRISAKSQNRMRRTRCLVEYKCHMEKGEAGKQGEREWSLAWVFGVWLRALNADLEAQILRKRGQPIQAIHYEKVCEQAAFFFFTTVTTLTSCLAPWPLRQRTTYPLQLASIGLDWPLSITLSPPALLLRLNLTAALLFCLTRLVHHHHDTQGDSDRPSRVPPGRFFGPFFVRFLRLPQEAEQYNRPQNRIVILPPRGCLPILPAAP